MDTGTYFLLQSDRLRGRLDVEEVLARRQFARAVSTEDTSECRAVDEYPLVVEIGSRGVRARQIKHPMNYLRNIFLENLG